MSPPSLCSDDRLLEIKAEISTERLAALTSALRRGDRGVAVELIDGWEYLFDDPVSLRPSPTKRLTLWLKDEVRLHVEGGRYQHALALVERYATLPVPLNSADALALGERMLCR